MRAADEESPKRPDGTQTQVGSGTGGTEVHAFDRPAHLANQESTENETETPGDQRRDHGKKGDPRDRRSWVCRDTGHLPDDPVNRRCGCHDVAADDDKCHLHGEGNENPECLAAFDSQLLGALADEKADDKDNHHADQCEYPGIGEPLLAPRGQPQAESLKSAFFLYRFVVLCHADFSLLS